METRETDIDVAIIGGGPAGLSAALVLGRALKRTWLFDAGERRNAAAARLHGFVTRDGIPPPEFRRIAREQLAPYDVTLQSKQVSSVTPIEPGGAFLVAAEDGTRVRARRVILALGVIDEVPAIPGLSDAWGRSVFQCPHCHGFEHRGRPWGVLLTAPEYAEFALMLTGWTSELTAFTHGAFTLPSETVARLEAAGVRVEPSRLARLTVEAGGTLRAVELEGGGEVRLEALFMKPKQRLPALVGAIGVALDEAGFVRITPQCETSIPGLFAAGDLTTPLQGALPAAYQGGMAAWTIVHSLNVNAAHRHP